MRKTVSQMSLEKLIYYYAVLKFIALLPCCSFCRMLVNFIGGEYLRTVSKLKKKNKKVFLEFITPSKCKYPEVSCCSIRAKKCTKKQDACAEFC